MKKEANIVIKTYGSHGWEDLAYCKANTYEYVFRALMETYTKWQLVAHNSKGEIILSYNLNENRE